MTLTGSQGMQWMRANKVPWLAADDEYLDLTSIVADKSYNTVAI
jgi:hypothetical protein